MKRPVRTTALLLFLSADLAATIVAIRDPDPGYRLSCWFSLGRHHRFNELITTNAARENLDPTLVKAVVWRASGFSPQKIGPSRERGLMQIGEGIGMDWAAASHAATFMQADLFNADTNLRAGCWYLRRVMERWKDRDAPEVFALAEYTAGHAAVLDWAGPEGTSADLMQRITDPPTRTFVEDVLRRRAYYIAEHAH